MQIIKTVENKPKIHLNNHHNARVVRLLKPSEAQQKLLPIDAVLYYLGLVVGNKSYLFYEIIPLIFEESVVIFGLEV